MSQEDLLASGEAYSALPAPFIPHIPTRLIVREGYITEGDSHQVKEGYCFSRPEAEITIVRGDGNPHITHVYATGHIVDQIGRPMPEMGTFVAVVEVQSHDTPRTALSRATSRLLEKAHISGVVPLDDPLFNPPPIDYDISREGMDEKAGAHAFDAPQEAPASEPGPLPRRRGRPKGSRNKAKPAAPIAEVQSPSETPAPPADNPAQPTVSDEAVNAVIDESAAIDEPAPEAPADDWPAPGGDEL